MRSFLFIFFSFFFFLTLTKSSASEILTVQGQIASVQRYNLVTKPAPYIQFILKANDEEFTVDVGPEWYVHSQGLFLIPREEIEVQGFLIEEEGRKILFAKEIKQETTTLRIRDESGKPLWGFD